MATARCLRTVVLCVWLVSSGCSGEIEGAEAGRGGARARAGEGGRARAGEGGSSAAGGSGGRGGSGATEPHTTYYTQGGVLHDPCGEPVVLRGINHPTLYVDRSGEALPEIAKTGANSVRLFWYAGNGIAVGEAEPAIAAAIDNQLLPILEMHDSTCEWNLDEIVDYWTSDEAVELITKYQSQLIVNIANEPSAPSDSAFRSKYSEVVRTLRDAGIHVPLMIDGSRCGRDYDVLLSQGPAVLQADPDHNVIFSAHLYDPLSAAELAGVYRSFQDASLTFVVGEFANKSPPGCGAPLDYEALIAEAEKHAIGWLAWSWGDDNPSSDWNTDCGEFDMASTFAFDSLRSWGREVAVTLPDSIMNTAVRPHSLTNAGACR